MTENRKPSSDLDETPPTIPELLAWLERFADQFHEANARAERFLTDRFFNTAPVEQSAHSITEPTDHGAIE